MHQTIIFFLPENGPPKLVRQDNYAELAKGAVSSSQYRSQRVRVADWYIEINEENQWKLQNETYSFLRFDDDGYAKRPEGHVDREKPDRPQKGSDTWAPSEPERLALQHLLEQHLKNQH